MRTAALILGIVVSAVLLAAAGVLYTLAGNTGAQPWRGTIEQVRAIQQLSSSRSVEVARVRADPLADFDSLAAFIPRMTRLKEALSDAARRTPDLPDRLAADIQAYLAAIDAQEERIERFKTGYAVVRNSTRYLPLAAANVARQAEAAGEAALGRDVAALVQSMNGYLSTPTDAARERLAAEVEALREASVGFAPALANALANLLAHTEVLLARQAPTEALFAEATSDDLAGHSGRLAASLGFERDRAAARGTLYERAMLGVFGVLALFWVGLALQQRARGGAVVEAVPELAGAADEGAAPEPRPERIEPLPALGLADGPLGALVPVDGAAPADLSAEAALRHGYLAERVGESLAGAAGRIAARMDALVQTHRRVRSALAASELMVELPEGADLDEEVEAGAAIAAHVRREANAMADLGKRLAAFSGLPNGEAERDMVDVNACIEEVLAAMHTERSARVARRLGDIPDVFASRTEVRLLLAQILDNAMRAVEGLDGREPTIKVDTAQRDGEVAITVIDNGDGIAPERRAQVFRPFYTSRDGAMGLGLTLAGELVKRYEGAIKVNSLAGRGTVARITLPTGTPGP